MICADAPAAGPVTVSASQPADMSTCAAVLIAGSDLGAINGIAMPSPTDFAGAWFLGFALVLGSYLVSWPVGAVLRAVGDLVRK